MSFVPVVPFGGPAGWSFLKRTMAAQAGAHAATPALARDEAHFRARIGTVRSAEALVSDPRLMRVALGAFGLEADARNTFFIRKVLEEGTLDPGALANRLADKRYRAFSAAFGFGDFSVPRTVLSDFGNEIVARWKERGFEAAVGAVSEPMRLALNARREIAALAAEPSSVDTKWYTIMGTPPLRKVVEGALGMPPTFAALPLDRQLTMLKDRSAAAFGASGVEQFTQPDRMEALITRYLIRAETGPAPGGVAATTPGSAALALLQGASLARRR
jgi:hypothetical protein